MLHFSFSKLDQYMYECSDMYVFGAPRYVEVCADCLIYLIKIFTKKYKGSCFKFCMNFLCKNDHVVHNVWLQIVFL
jgi:hypothetical protein